MPERYLLLMVLLVLTSLVSECANAGFLDHLGIKIPNPTTVRPPNGINDLARESVNPITPLPQSPPFGGNEIQQTITNPCRTNPNLPQCSGADVVEPAPQ
jgi:hypothetical protein